MTTLQGAMDVLRRFSAPAVALGNEWLKVQEKRLEAGEQGGAPGAGAG